MVAMPPRASMICSGLGRTCHCPDTLMRIFNEFMKFVCERRCAPRQRTVPPAPIDPLVQKLADGKPAAAVDAPAADDDSEDKANAPVAAAAAAAPGPEEAAPPAAKRARPLLLPLSEEDHKATLKFLTTADCYWCLAVCMFGLPARPNSFPAFLTNAQLAQGPPSLLPDGKKALASSRAKARAEAQEQLQERRGNHAFDLVFQNIAKNDAYDRELARLLAQQENISTRIKMIIMNPFIAQLTADEKAVAMEKYKSLNLELEGVAGQIMDLNHKAAALAEADAKERTELQVSAPDVAALGSPASLASKSIASQVASRAAARSVAARGDPK
jgi:hypothetical protein